VAYTYPAVQSHAVQPDDQVHPLRSTRYTENQLLHPYQDLHRLWRISQILLQGRFQMECKPTGQNPYPTCALCSGYKEMYSYLFPEVFFHTEIHPVRFRCTAPAAEAVSIPVTGIYQQDSCC